MEQTHLLLNSKDAIIEAQNALIQLQDVEIKRLQSKLSKRKRDNEPVPARAADAAADRAPTNAPAQVHINRAPPAPLLHPTSCPHQPSLQGQVFADEAQMFLAAGQYALAVSPLQRAIELKHLPSLALMAWLLIHGREGIAKDTKAALELAEEGTRLGCHHCQGLLASETEPIVIGDPQTEAKKLALAIASCQSGSMYGQYALGELRYADAEANDDAEALALFQLAAEQNLDRAQLKLGKILYRNGLCPPEQHAEALRWFKLAAGQGDGDGLFMVGYMHELGHSVPADKNAAVRWYKRAVAAGHFRAAFCVQKLNTLALVIDDELDEHDT